MCKLFPDSTLLLENNFLLGVTYNYLGFLDKSLDYHLASLEGRSSFFGAESLPVAESKNRIGELFYYGFRRTDLAAPFLNSALLIRTKNPSVNSFDLAISYYNNSIFYLREQDYTLGMSYAKKAFDIIKKSEYIHYGFLTKCKNSCCNASILPK